MRFWLVCLELLIGVSLLVFASSLAAGAIYSFELVWPLISQIAPASFEALSVFIPPEGNLFYFIFATLTGFFLMVLISGYQLLVRQKNWWGQFNFKHFWPRLGQTGLGFLAYFAISFFVWLIIALVLYFLPFEPEPQEVAFELSGSRTLALLTLVVVVPFYEELLFRAFLYRRLRQIVKPWLAIFTTSLLFGLLHFHFIGSFDTFILSVAILIIYERTHWFWGAFLMHAAKNCLAFFLLSAALV